MDNAIGKFKKGEQDMDYEDGIATIPCNVKPGQEIYIVNEKNKTHITRNWVKSIIFDDEGLEAKVCVRKYGTFTKKDFGRRIFLTPQEAFDYIGLKGHISSEEAAKRGMDYAIGEVVFEMICEKYGDFRYHEVEEFAKDAALDEYSIHKITRHYGDKEISVSVLAQIAAFFGTTIEEILKKAENWGKKIRTDQPDDRSEHGE
jgi:hypothetical protein